MRISAYILLVLFYIFPIQAEPLDNPNDIVDNINKNKWELANEGLIVYRKNNPDATWAYSSGIWVLENLKEFDSAIELGIEGRKKWPDDLNIKKSYSQVLYRKAKLLETNKEDSNEILKLLNQSFEMYERDFVLLSMIQTYRNIQEYDKAIELIHLGNKKFPKFTYYSSALPYTRYLRFKKILSSKYQDEIKSEIQLAFESLDTKKKLADQFYYSRMINMGLREVNDQKYFEEVYSKLVKKFKNDPKVYDDYGFFLYANFRLNNESSKEIKAKAINLRRKAYDLYWSNSQKPNEIKNLEFPLKGKYAIWAEFGGTAMTHNGYAKYCYDFAAVDNDNQIKKPGSSGSSNSDYYMFGQPIYAVANGKVISVIDEFEDNVPGGYSGDANTITIDHGDYLSFYAHQKLNSAKVKPGDSVEKGKMIGLAGNSGMSSESHLHFCIYNNKEKDGESITIPFQFKPATIESKSGILEQVTRPYREDEWVIFK